MNIQLEKKAIERLKAFEPSKGYYLAYSGGKDSDVIKTLATLANVKFEAVHNLTTVDAPETVRYIRSQPDVKIASPEKTMWQLISNKKIPPTRLNRYCCEALKECGGKGRLVVTGVRWDESSSRKESSGLINFLNKPKTTQKIAELNGAKYSLSKQGGIILNDDNDECRRTVEQCYRTGKTLINPIIEWLDNDVWEFLKHYGIDSNPLYQCGFDRIGCIGCPLASKRKRLAEFKRYPKYKLNYIKAFDRMLLERKKCDLPTDWQSGEEVFKWWMEDDYLQQQMFEIYE